jgi:hypothetical protein
MLKEQGDIRRREIKTKEEEEWHAATQALTSTCYQVVRLGLGRQGRTPLSMAVAAQGR